MPKISSTSFTALSVKTCADATLIFPAATIEGKVPSVTAPTIKNSATPMYPAATMESTPNSSKGKRKPHISGKSKEQFEISSKVLKVPAQSVTLLGRSMEPKPIQPEPQMQTYQVIKHGGKIT